jgi:hypothetical protein
MDEKTSLHDLGEPLLTSADPGAVTDNELSRLFELTVPNVFNAWTHVIPALASYAESQGKQSLLGRDKGEEAYRELIEKLKVLILGLYSDKMLSRGASTDDCLLALVRSLVIYKGAFPNWSDAYSAGYKVFVERSENMGPILEELQRTAEAELF